MNLSIGCVFLREKHYAKLAHDSVEGSVRERKRGGVGRLEGYLFAGANLRASTSRKTWKHAVFEVGMIK